MASPPLLPFFLLFKTSTLCVQRFRQLRLCLTGPLNTFLVCFMFPLCLGRCHFPPSYSSFSHGQGGGRFFMMNV
ncbi:hypothetical protein DFJ73DRAFT_849322, partial [Zopfochytrium polystomum]